MSPVNFRGDDITSNQVAKLTMPLHSHLLIETTSTPQNSASAFCSHMANFPCVHLSSLRLALRSLGNELISIVP
ncbi:hypothetical protein C9I98_00010 [Photobacterium sanctipauli]|uniref:Uncharacterized protein n=1 Tax=Photobacterium sanctipauli TaxID=1342794 RepID=A0A2T3NZI4_9GAMM|nr:hypothetical protein C9I98_00010 [Photobacterium sanctipauli]